MKILLRLGVIASMLSILGSCSLLSNGESNDGEYDERPSSAISQEVTQKGAASVSFRVTASWGSSCGSFSRSEVTHSDSVYAIRIIGRQPKDAVCLTVMSSFPAPVKIDLPGPGTYRFTFWQSDSGNRLDTTITFN